MKKIVVLLAAILLMIAPGKAQTEINYETVSIALTSVNTALTALNASGITPSWQTQYTSGLAILTGAGQLAYGIYEAGTTMTTWDIVNITAGATTIITNSILLYNTFHKTKKKTAWNPYFAPTLKGQPQFGIRIVRNF